MFTYDEKYKFTEEWFDPMISIWEQLFEKYEKENIKSVLEVGCFEGRATIFLCENILQEGTNYDIVDTFIYNNFTHNISHHPQINFNISKGYSQHVLPTLVEQNKQYDFIYIDASHRADDTFVDAYYAHKMLNKGGILIFDDFGWKDPNAPHAVNSPELGIRMFFSMYDNYYKLIMSGYQIGAEKIK